MVRRVKSRLAADNAQVVGVPFATQLRRHGTEVQQRLAKEKELVEKSIEKESYVAEVVIDPNLSITVAESPTSPISL